MNVLIVSQPASDGVLSHVDLLCRYLISQGVHLHLAYSDLQACEQLHALVKHVAENGGRTFNLRTGNSPQAADLPALLGLRHLIQEIRPDVIHAHSSKAGGLVRGLGLLGLRTPIFYTPHAYFRMHDQGNLKARVFHWAERVLGTVGTSIGMGTFESNFASKVLKVPPSRRLIIPNGIDTNRYSPVAPGRKPELRDRFDLPRDALVLGSVGRFSLQKDPVTLYAALARVFAQAPDLHFIHLGRGELEPEIDAFLASQPFAGKVRRIPYMADSSPFYQMLDGFVLASRYEGLSYAALEALACDLPTVLTDAPGNSDLADYGFSHIWRAKPGDVDSVAQAILAWSAAIRDGVRPNHREVMLREFTQDICNSRVLAAYQNALQSRRHPSDGRSAPASAESASGVASPGTP